MIFVELSESVTGVVWFSLCTIVVRRIYFKLTLCCKDVAFIISLLRFSFNVGDLRFGCMNVS